MEFPSSVDQEYRSRVLIDTRLQVPLPFAWRAWKLKTNQVNFPEVNSKVDEADFSHYLVGIVI